MLRWRAPKAPVVEDLDALVSKDGSDPDLRLRLAARHLRENRLREAEREIDLALALTMSGTRARLTAVVLRQRVRNLIVQRELLEADRLPMDDR